MLFPESEADVDPVLVYGKAYRAAPADRISDRPWVIVNMIVSVDGHTAVAGKSGGLGSDADREVFRALRAIPDVVIAGSATVLAEDYGPARLDPPLQRMRTGRGQTPVPQIGVVTGSLRLDWDARLFTEEAEVDAPPPLVITSASADADRLAAAYEHADVELAGDARTVDMTAALEALNARGAQTVLCEGGPRVNAALLEAGLVDELALTIAPALVGGDSASAFAAAGLAEPQAMRLTHLLEEAGYLFLRYARSD